MLHGLYLVINHAFKAMGGRLGPVASWSITFLAVVVAWVFFRADSLASALRMLAAMAHLPAQDGMIFNTEPATAARAWLWIALLTGLALLAPNSQEIMRNYLGWVARTDEPPRLSAVKLTFRFSRGWAIAAGAIVALGLAYLPQPASFLYFNF